ncbi:hypothetical protein V8C86DRAFT_3104624 [Haematococcus lacustris]
MEKERGEEEEEGVERGGLEAEVWVEGEGEKDLAREEGRGEEGGAGVMVPEEEGRVPGESGVGMDSPAGEVLEERGDPVVAGEREGEGGGREVAMGRGGQEGLEGGTGGGMAATKAARAAGEAGVELVRAGTAAQVVLEGVAVGLDGEGARGEAQAVLKAASVEASWVAGASTTALVGWEAVGVAAAKVVEMVGEGARVMGALEVKGEEDGEEGMGGVGAVMAGAGEGEREARGVSDNLEPAELLAEHQVATKGVQAGQGAREEGAGTVRLERGVGVE